MVREMMEAIQRDIDEVAELGSKFKEKAFRQIIHGHGYSNNLREVIAFDDRGYLVDVALTRKELVLLMNNAKVKGLSVVDDNGNRYGYDLIHERLVEGHSSIWLTGLDVGLDYVTKQLLDSANNVNELEKEMIYGNRFIHGLSELLNKSAGIPDIEFIHLKDNANGRLPQFKTLTFRGRAFELFITGQQMSFITGLGFVKIHDTGKSVDAVYLSKLISRVYKLQVQEVHKVLTNTYGF